MEVGELREFFLRETALESKLAHAATEYGSRVEISHPVIIRT